MRSLLVELVLVVGIAFALSQDAGGFVDPEGLLAAQLPDGRFVEVGVNDDLGYEVTLFDTHAKVIRSMDGAALWADEFVPALVCGLGANRILVLDNPGSKSRKAITFDVATGKVVAKAVFPISHVDGIHPMSDGSLLAQDGPDFIDLSKSGKVLWQKRILIDTHGDSKLSPVYDAFGIMADGSVVTFQDQTHRLQLWDSKFKPLKTITMPNKVDFWFTQRMGVGKGGFWLEQWPLENGVLVKIDLTGKASAPRKVHLEDGSEFSWLDFIGETADGDPVVWFGAMMVVGPGGKVK